MRVVKKEKETKIIDKTVDILCNMCGETCCNSKRKDPSSVWEEYSGLIETEVHGGYDSEKIGDMTSIRFSICEHCLKEHLLDKFKIPYDIKSIDLSSEYIPLPKYQELERKASKQNRKDWINALINKGYKLEEIKDLSPKELYDLYYK